MCVQYEEDIWGFFMFEILVKADRVDQEVERYLSHPSSTTCSAIRLQWSVLSMIVKPYGELALTGVPKEKSRSDNVFLINVLGSGTEHEWGKSTSGGAPPHGSGKGRREHTAQSHAGRKTVGVGLPKR